MRDKALSAAINPSKHEKINQAYSTFKISSIPRKNKFPGNLESGNSTPFLWRDCLKRLPWFQITPACKETATNSGRKYPLWRRISVPFPLAATASMAFSKDLPALAGIMESTLDGNLHAYKGESFVYLKRIGSEKEENRLPPIAAQRIRVGTGGAYDAIVRPNSWYEAWMLEPTTLVIGCTTFISPRNGGNGPCPPSPSARMTKRTGIMTTFLTERTHRGHPP